MTSLVFENQFGKLTVRGAEGLGLPTSGDTDVIVGLMQLTREKNGFTSATVPFTRYELLRLLGRADKSQHYKRLDESLNRWMGVTLLYTGSWFDRIEPAASHGTSVAVVRRGFSGRVSTR